MGEADFIAALSALAPHPAARGLADDAAVLAVGNETLVLTADTMVEGTHWPAQQSLADVAWKLVAVNLSDLAAKGAEPVGILLSYMLGEGDKVFLEGLHEALDTFGVPLLGGDTVRASGARSFSVTAIGRATHTPVPARSGASPGDGLFLCGSIGGAMMGFEAITTDSGADISPFTRPTPLLAEGRALAPHVTAMMDVSDGLLLDAWRMAEASGATLEIDSGAVPLGAPEDRRADALRWGDDYALLFASPAERTLPVAATRIGTVVERGAAPVMLDGKPPKQSESLGYRH
ncbi:thiamine-phosphate kinase [Alteriqipengyuania lutimaris]|uniref:Thiamine-monophosphate kinase n=1 Tax=Alteriqipengyuania lutimaris TaxID=1538146 RepID=A0A395LL26_9SPHN|nr:thiamine-phosphate kinase [Alteriqipengyuania lutimaris]MBB3033240.1 thiamine-monophosphate kinase [Alteriqipengyuania lutimaris]RDS77713.1 thiamine-phosphate kinase [Alteriqipengyuania lutimaris]